MPDPVAETVDTSNSAPETTASAAAPAAPDPAATAPGQGANGEAKPGDAAKPATDVPEKYEFKLPEGMPEGMTLSDAAVQAFEPLARELKLTQEQAQKLVDLHAQQVAAAGQAHVDQVKQWAESLKSDPEIGGVFAEANHAIAQKAIAKYGTPALKQFLEETGLGNHPEVVRFCLRVGKGISEDTATPGAQPAGAGEPDARTLYPNSNHA